MSLNRTKYEGVYYRINRRGKKTYVARFAIDGKPHKRVVGSEPDITARIASKLREKMIDEVLSGISARGKRIDDLFDGYIEFRRASLSQSWYYNIQKNYNLYLRHQIGNKFPQDVTVHEIQKIIDDMLLGRNPKQKKYKPSTVKQVKDIVSGLYRYLIDMEFPVENIGHKLIIPKFDNKIYFTISESQAKKLFDTILNYDDPKWRAYFVWLLHGRRKMEVAVMRIEWLDMDNMVYRIPADQNKTKRIITAPMTDLLRDAILGMPIDINSKGYIFTGTGSSGHISSTGIDFQWRNIRSLAGVPKMRLHDIRHLIGFIGINSGYSLEQIGSVLGHTSTATTKRYSNMKVESATEVLRNMFDRFTE